MTFRIGEKVVFPNYGVGTIENISTRCFGAQAEHFYLFRLAASSLTVMLPFSHVQDVGLRKITCNGEVERVLMFLAGGKCKGCADWKNRFKENSERMRNGGLIEIAEVLKGLLVLQTRKPLSFREKKMLDRARHMLITEISTSRSLSMDQAAELLQKALAKSALSLPPPL